jgi:hypothetical protein
MVEDASPPLPAHGADALSAAEDDERISQIGRRHFDSGQLPPAGSTQ